VSQYTLHSSISGSGKTIVLLHGYLSSSQYFKAIRPYLDKDFRVVAIDLLGFGQSPKPHIAYTYDDHIDAIHTTLQKLQIETPFILLGHSMGALIALRYANTYPDAVSKLLLFNTPLFIDKSQMADTHKATGRHYRIMLYSRSRHLYWQALRLIPHHYSQKRPPINFTDTIAMSAAAREGSYKNILGGSKVFEDFKRSTVPILLVNGQYDRAVYLENLQNHDLPSNITLVTIETGHHPIVRNVPEAAELIRSYLVQ
jgi:pimeloyl-ACP methyl ester carboxylesterase